MRTHTLRVEADPEGLAEIVAEIKRRGYPVECSVFDGRERLKERDELLREALALMPGPTCWARCCQLEKEISTFECVIWPRFRDNERPPETFLQLRRSLFVARKSGPLPASARQLLNILRNATTVAVSEGANENSR